ncbi:riboflavin kinase [Candidatus Berkelbacteria bacterium]|nr:riboflavin kinase [Candidatus Berkelbacteria bacterium]
MKQKKWWRARVIRGKGLGKQLGYPTANLELPNNWQLDYGIYATDVRVADAGFGGVLYWGTKGGTGDSLEIFIFDFSGDLYGKTITFEIGRFIRADRAIASEIELKAQIAADVAVAKKIR